MKLDVTIGIRADPCTIGMVGQTSSGMMSPRGGMLVGTTTAGRRSEAGISQSRHTRIVTYKDFVACQPPKFEGEKDPIISSWWLSEKVGAFLTSFCPADVKVRFAANLLRGPAQDWWNVVNGSRSPEKIEALTWEQFTEMFKAEFAPQI
ncbi:hypothetical protein OSB04_024134 [Centaurea solstitialis]|uniref:Retrotransposon gag domain-containing protein n=1 Tax=Centaurea solstitialis TaxID=347529 RepID=A0AA38W2V3_9ASTR|nr:hypothetical protein OSB04_024134 [Centaurea solstitialis]